MSTVESNNTHKKTPDSVGAEPGVMTNNIQANGITSNLTTHPTAITGRGEPSRLSPSSIRDAAKDYIQRGWCPIPIPYKQKGPRLDKWQELRLNLDNLPRYFTGEPQNIGIILGEPSGGLIDIDLDAPEAIKLAKAFLPPTEWVFGRSSKRRSHWIYITNPIPETMQFATSEGAMLVELRSTGAQTIFPPSVHESGEPIAFVRQGEISSVSAEELQDKVARLAAAALLVRHWPKKGSRQDTAMALAGGLAKAGWEKADIRHFMLEVAKAAGDEEATQRVRCVDRTTDRTQADDPVTGWPRLRDLVGGQVVDRLRKWLTLHETAKDQIRAIRTGRGRADEKHRSISTIVIDDLSDSGVFYKTPHELYYFDQLDYRLFPLTDAEFRARINDRFDINGTESTWKFVLEELNKKALLHGQETTIYQFSRYQSDILYLYKGSEKVFRITSEGWAEVPNGTDGILFLNPDMEPVELSSDVEASGALDRLIKIPNFDGSGNLSSEQESQLYRLWVFSLFFESRLPTKPILLLLGVKGSGKTMGLRALLRALFGKKAQVLTLSKDNKDAFEATVTSHHLAAFDNLDGEIPWLPNHLAIAATGGDIPKRKLYTTNEFVSYPVRCFLALTSREPDSLTRDDVVDRLLTLKVDRMLQFTPESQFLAEIDAARPKIWTELVQNLQRIVAALQHSEQHTSVHRLADFASLAMNIGPVLGIKKEEVLQLLEGMDSEKTDFALEHNPLFPILFNWLEDGGLDGRENIDSKTLFDELDKQLPSGSRLPYKNASALSRALNNLKTELAEWIEIVGPEKISGGNNKNFWKIHQGPKLALSPKESEV